MPDISDSASTNTGSITHDGTGLGEPCLWWRRDSKGALRWAHEGCLGPRLDDGWQPNADKLWRVFPEDRCHYCDGSIL